MMLSEKLIRAERKADREQMRSMIPVVDEYGVPTGLLESVEVSSGPPMPPREEALLAKAAALVEIGYEAKLARADDLAGVVARARQQSERRRLLERLPRSGGRPDRGRVAVRSLSGAFDPPAGRRSTFDRGRYVAELRARSQRGGSRRGGGAIVR